MKLKLWHFLLILFIAWFAVSYGLISINWSGWQPQTSEQEGVVVTRSIQFTVYDKYGGAAVASASIYIYDENLYQLETLTTDSNGQATTSKAYTSGTKLYVLVTKSNDKAWYQIVVPTMNEADVEAMTTIPMTLEFFDLDTSMTIKVIDQEGNVYSSGDTLNLTNLGLDKITLTISGYVSADGKGFISSHDPLNDIDWNVILYTSLSGTGYELISITGFDRGYEKGTTMYYAEKLEDTEVTKYKVGNSYVYDGVWSRTVSLDATGYSGSSVTLTIIVYAYSDPDYHFTYGSYGPDAVAMCTAFTLTIQH